MYQVVKNIPNICKIFQMALKYINIFRSNLVSFTISLVYLMVIWYIFPHLVCRNKKNLATPVSML
jgi:hypothetical protein